MNRDVSWFVIPRKYKEKIRPIIIMSACHTCPVGGLWHVMTTINLIFQIPPATLWNFPSFWSLQLHCQICSRNGCPAVQLSCTVLNHDFKLPPKFYASISASWGRPEYLVFIWVTILRSKICVEGVLLCHSWIGATRRAAFQKYKAVESCHNLSAGRLMFTSSFNG